MLILGIESSCDETSVALVKDGRQVVASLVISQIDRHAVFGGVIPEIAAREHLQALDPLMRKLFTDTAMTLNDIDAIAVTQGPGLIGALLVGTSYAKGLALASKKTLIPVDHVHAHVLGALLDLEIANEQIFPCLAAVVSGGHTNLYFMSGPTEFELMANTIDDACGESFDKVSKLLGLGYPGGPSIEKRAQLGHVKAYSMPVMIEQKKRLAFSYSGLKTFMVNLKRKIGEPLSDEQINDLCASFQEAALDQLIRKIKSALEIKKDVRNILVAGGVSANGRFRSMMAEKIKVPAIFPHLKYCSDNAAMIAALGYFIYMEKIQEESAYDFGIAWDNYSRYQYPEC